MSKIKNRPVTIELILTEGSPFDVKIAEIPDRIVKILIIPREKLSQIEQRDDLKDIGVYFLVEKKDLSMKPKIYIGHAKDCYVRLKEHNRSKGFWDIGIVVLTSNDFLTVAHAMYLEWLCYEECRKANRYELDQNVPDNGEVKKETVKAYLQNHFDTIKTIVSALGYPIFVQKPTQPELFFCKGRGVKAIGSVTDDGFMVFKGSEMSIENTSCRSESLRSQLIEDKILKLKDNKFIFRKDHVFSSPSSAASIVLGRQSNGRIEWKSESGQPLSES